MADGENTTYRLYAMRVTEETAAIAEAARFSYINRDYVMIYTADEAPRTGAVEITEKETDLLGSRDRDWLLACNMTLLAEDARRREKEISATLGEKIERLEKALEEASRAAKQEERADVG